jgi:hypothetical protein
LVDNVPKKKTVSTTLLDSSVLDTAVKATAIFDDTGIVCMIGDETLPIPVNLKNKVYIGRDVTARLFASFIDLSPFGGRELGVSRIHAVIEKSLNGIYQIMDLGSMNGSKIDGNRLKPFKLYPLTDDMKISIGSFPIRLQFHNLETNAQVQ